jgi:tRNA modification GTPase
MKFSQKTIFAPATGIGESGLTVIRISGVNTFPILSKIFSKKIDKFWPVDFSNAPSHTAHHGYIFYAGEVIDEVVITIFKSPNSFTGEDVAEISTHGGSYIYRKISSLLSDLGIAYAEPGEFSKRAFLNGKMDLAQAEAVADLIRAKTELSNKLAIKQLTGEFSKKINELRDELINYCSLLELELDFSEEGIDLVSKEELLRRIDSLIDKFTKLTVSYESGKIIKNGVNLAIIGRPNVGKSTIFNYLLKENRAIVSHIAGTTRDYLQEPLIMGGIVFNLIDTAGMRSSADEIEQEGVKRSIQKIEEADIILEVEDLTNSNLDNFGYLENVQVEKIVKAFNKADISNRKNGLGGFCVSALTGLNMNKLQNEIIERSRLLIKESEISEMIITNIRHRNCLLKSCQYLVNAKNLIKGGGGNELISFEIRTGIEALTEIIGKTTNVDILNNIFVKFCIGK